MLNDKSDCTEILYNTHEIYSPFKIEQAFSLNYKKKIEKKWHLKYAPKSFAKCSWIFSHLAKLYYRIKEKMLWVFEIILLNIEVI